MSEVKDLVIASTFNVPTGAAQQIKPCYLVKFVASAKKTQLFIVIGEPKFETAFVQGKGFFVDSGLDEEDVVTSYQKLVTGVDKSTMVEMWLPWHNIVFVRSLVYKGK